jgi:hypothetical protein
MKIKLKKLKLNNIISLIYQNLDFNQIESSKYCKIIKNSNSNSIYYFYFRDFFQLYDFPIYIENNIPKNKYIQILDRDRFNELRLTRRTVVNTPTFFDSSLQEYFSNEEFEQILKMNNIKRYSK